ncbi:MAG TPA: zinc metallopeptidase, partial [Clostridiales bacterium]|nr:zinc metallopeptidase [Clostridiales bacterium]
MFYSPYTGIQPEIIFLFPAILFAMYAQAKVQRNFNQYLQVGNIRGYTGAQAARLILDRSGLQHVAVEPIEGYLSDHYDPRVKVLRLSPQVYYGTSIASVSVAAHEAGHA